MGLVDVLIENVSRNGNVAFTPPPPFTSTLWNKSLRLAAF
jgi:hypothetical protein